MTAHHLAQLNVARLRAPIDSPLAAFAFRSHHRDIMVRRREWFERMTDAYVVLWWIPTGSVPSVTEARDRLDLLRRCGPTADAFTFRTSFSPLGEPVRTRPVEVG